MNIEDLLDFMNQNLLPNSIVNSDDMLEEIFYSEAQILGM
jgi:hypothetical protein